MADGQTSIPDLLEIDQSISEAKNQLSLFTRSDLLFYPLCLCNLALEYWRRFCMSRDERDLDKSLLHFTHAIFLPIYLAPDGPSPIAAFNFITEGLLYRMELPGQPLPSQVNTIKHCVKNLQLLRELPLEAFGVDRNTVTAHLLSTLALEAEIEDSVSALSAVVTTNIKRMVALCHELLASDDLEGLPTSAIREFTEFITFTSVNGLKGLDPQCLDPVIECLRQVNIRLPGLHDIPFVLSFVLFCRFKASQSLGDYDEAVAILDSIIASHSSTDDPSRRSRIASSRAARYARYRFEYYHSPEYLEDAIFRHRTHLNILPLEDSDRPSWIQDLNYLQKARFDMFGITNSDAEAHPRDPEEVPLPPFSDLAASLLNRGDTDFNSMPVIDQRKHSEAIMSMSRITNLPDFEEAVKYAKILLTSLDPTTFLAFIVAFNLGQILFKTFQFTNDTEYLDGSITTLRGILDMPEAHFRRARIILELVEHLYRRWKLFKDVKDSDEIIQLLSEAASDPHAIVLIRFRAAGDWAACARFFKHPSLALAYESGLALMQSFLTFAPTLETQHFQLSATDTDFGPSAKLPLDYASFQVNTGQIEQAVETLEKGRGLLFSEMRGLRTSLDQLRDFDTSLADKFANINQDLENLTTTTVSSGASAWLSDMGAQAQDRMEPFGQLVIKQRKLVEERDGLISHIRTLSGFERFLMAPPFDTLRSAAVSGPVIIINHSAGRSDIIILLPDSPPSLIPMPDYFYHCAEDMSNDLLAVRKQGLDSAAYEEMLRDVLACLYLIVGRPVIQRLQELNVPEQSRIWWCPTSVFCSLPLHAMGPIPSDVGPPRYFLDLYISSYTPSLSALIESRKPSSQTFDEPSMLLVVQPDATMVQASREIQVIRGITPWATTLVGAKATPTVTLERLRDNRFAHIVCHGLLEPGKPFGSSFMLHDGERLSLLEIFRSQLPNAEFAFLSACHTAEVTDKSPFDETLHLAAAMQYCGFRSVVGTMWAMADTDGPDLSRNFYKSLFSSRRPGEHYYESTAEALRDAVLKLRRKRGISLERWVNYAHYGA